MLARSELRDVAATAPRRQLAPVNRDHRRYRLMHGNIGEFTTAKTDRHFALGLDILTQGLRSALAQ